MLVQQEFYLTGIKELLINVTLCIAVMGDYVEYDIEVLPY